MSSSVQSISLSKLSITPHLSNARRSSPLRPVVKAVKRIFRKIKLAPLLDRLKSEYIPYEEWEELYLAAEMAEKLSNTESWDSTVFDYEFASYRIRKAAKYIQEEGAPAAEKNAGRFFLSGNGTRRFS